jgi:flagellar basal body rod protein FlgG
MQISASGALASIYRMDVLANNLANATTPSFKPDLPVISQRDAARVEDGLGFMPSDALLERLGGGVMPIANRISWEQGTLTTTGNALDVAIEGEGFFVLRDRSDGQTDRIRLTRDGRFTRNDRGLLVSATTGMPVLDVNNRTIEIPGEGKVQIQATGEIRQNETSIGRIQVTEVDRSRLTKLGHGMYRAPSEAFLSRRPAGGVVRQGSLEGSAVDAISMMMAITEAGRAAESNFSMIASADRIMDRAINGLGRVSG